MDDLLKVSQRRLEFARADSERRRLEYLATLMIPVLIAKRFDLGEGQKPDEYFVERAMKLAIALREHSLKNFEATLIDALKKAGLE